MGNSKGRDGVEGLAYAKHQDSPSSTSPARPPSNNNPKIGNGRARARSRQLAATRFMLSKQTPKQLRLPF